MDATVRFAVEHEGEDTSRLLFAASRYPDVDMRRAAVHIEARAKAKQKIPQWYDNKEVIYPSALSMEQCSSQTTALYKRRFVERLSSGDRLPSIADLTGGFGIDCYYMSRAASSALYVERNVELFNTARCNYNSFGVNNVTFLCSDAEKSIELTGGCDLVFIDPARRSQDARRIYGISDCEPDIIKLKGDILSLVPNLLVKLSPMADVRRTMELLPECTELHIVSVDNECKELLALLKSGADEGEPQIIAVNFDRRGETEFRFRLSEEPLSSTVYAEHLCRYLYQPNRSILKSGAFKLAGSRFGLAKLASSTHLYTSDTFLTDFPGRIFEITDSYPFSNQAIKRIRTECPGADCLAVNFINDTAALRKRLGLREGGDKFIIGTTLSSGEKVLLCCVNARSRNTF